MITTIATAVVYSWLCVASLHLCVDRNHVECDENHNCLVALRQMEDTASKSIFVGYLQCDIQTATISTVPDTEILFEPNSFYGQICTIANKQKTEAK